MAKERIYNCCICKQVVENKKTIRLCKQLYGISKNGGHYTVEYYDFCAKCFNPIKKYIKKHQKEGE